MKSSPTRVDTVVETKKYKLRSLARFTKKMGCTPSNDNGRGAIITPPPRLSTAAERTLALFDDILI